MHLRRTSHEAQVVYATDGERDWQLSLRVSRMGTGFDGVHPFFRERRKDHTRSVSLKVAHRALDYRGYRPQLRLEWSETKSNIPLYERRSRILRLGLLRVF